MPAQLRCPAHATPLTAGLEHLACQEGCRAPIVRGVPRFVESAAYAAGFGLQWRRHRRTQLDSHTGLPISRDRLQRCLGGSFDLVRGRDVLEAGCGAGRFTEVLLAEGARVFACDLSEAVETTQENVGASPALFVCQADLLRLPVTPASFDVVLCLGVLQHTPDPEASLAALAAAVRPGGWLVVDHYTFRPRNTPFWNLLNAVHPRSLARQTLLRLAPARAQRGTELLTRGLLPLHRLFWREGRLARLGRRMVKAISPVFDYYDAYPGLSRETLVEWSYLDTHDGLTDRYKHLRDVHDIDRTLAGLGFIERTVGYGGNGVEARARKP